jgi:CRISPR/Cas system CMR-associated protein Cmr3 (group 5 of RAMP superfamily)
MIYCDHMIYYDDMIRFNDDYNVMISSSSW